MKLRNQSRKAVSLGLLVALTAGMTGGALVAPAQAKSSSKWKNGAILGGVVTGYGLLKHNKTATILGGVGTVYSYSRYQKERKKEKRSEEASRQQWYRSRYGRNWRDHYVPGH